MSGFRCKGRDHRTVTTNKKKPEKPQNSDNQHKKSATVRKDIGSGFRVTATELYLQERFGNPGSIV